jgi:hypothetical protein
MVILKPISVRLSVPVSATSIIPPVVGLEKTALTKAITFNGMDLVVMFRTMLTVKCGGGLAINENDSNNPGAYYQAIGTNEDNFEVLVSMTVGDRSNFFFQNIVVSLYSGNVTGANGSSLSGLGATLLDSATITNSVFAGDTTDGNTHTATISGLALNTGTTGVAGQSLWLEISSSVPGSEVWKYQALIDDVSVIPESSAYGLIAGCLAMTWIMLRRRRS